jgi:hypothetical protein
VRADGYAIEANGLVDILDLLFAEKLKFVIELPLNLVECRSRNQDAPRRA